MGYLERRRCTFFPPTVAMPSKKARSRGSMEPRGEIPRISLPGS